MVLEVSQEPTIQDTLDQSAPADDDDPFATPQPGAPQHYHLDRSLLKPFPIIGPLLGYSQQMWEKTVQAYTQRAAWAVQRPLTQEEHDAYAYWTATAISRASYGTPLGVAGGWYAAYRSAQTFRYPFWQPNLDTFTPEIFPPRQALLRGNRAIMAWHATRILAYTISGCFFGNILISSVAASSASVNMRMDKRLSTVNEALIRRKQIQARNGPSRSPMRQQRGTGRASQDDASPTGGMYGAETAESKTSKAPPLEEIHETQDGGFAVYDDASPTGGQGVSADTALQQTTGSAWDRLRRGEKPIQNRQTGTDGSEGAAQRPSQSTWAKLRNSSQQGGHQNPATDEGYSYSEAREQRELAKLQAQKEFDAQLERERKGGDFGDSGDLKRW